MVVTPSSFAAMMELIQFEYIRDQAEVFVLDMSFDGDSLTGPFVGKLRKGQLAVLIGNERQTIPIRANLCSEPDQPRGVAISPHEVSLAEVIAGKVAFHLHRRDVRIALDEVNKGRSGFKSRLDNLTHAVQVGWKYLDEAAKEPVLARFTVDESVEPMNVLLR